MREKVCAVYNAVTRTCFGAKNTPHTQTHHGPAFHAPTSSKIVLHQLSVREYRAALPPIPSFLHSECSISFKAISQRSPATILCCDVIAASPTSVGVVTAYRLLPWKPYKYGVSERVVEVYFNTLSGRLYIPCPRLSPSARRPSERQISVVAVGPFDIPGEKPSRRPRGPTFTSTFSTWSYPRRHMTPRTSLEHQLTRLDRFNIYS